MVRDYNYFVNQKRGSGIGTMGDAIGYSLLPPEQKHMVTAERSAVAADPNYQPQAQYFAPTAAQQAYYPSYPTQPSNYNVQAQRLAPQQPTYQQQYQPYQSYQQRHQQPQQMTYSTPVQQPQQPSNASSIGGKSGSTAGISNPLAAYGVNLGSGIGAGKGGSSTGTSY